MTGSVRAMWAAFDEKCFVTRCKKGECRVTLRGAPKPYKVIDFDKLGSPLGKQDTRCDYLFIADAAPGWVAPMELSRERTKSPSKIVEQLQAGADIACQKLPKADVRFVPIFAGRLKKSQRKEIKTRTIQFRNKNETVRLIGCGHALRNALKKAAK